MIDIKQTYLCQIAIYLKLFEHYSNKGSILNRIIWVRLEYLKPFNWGLAKRSKVAYKLFAYNS